jgi:HD-like signal output (HDOD) protein
VASILSAKMIDVNSLPALPQALVDLIDACGHQDIPMSEVAPIVSRDPALAAKVLQLANSALLGARHPIADISQAVVFLGLDILRNLAISVSAHEVFRTSKGDSHWIAIFWHRAILAASFCQKLALKLRYGKPSEAYLAGLFNSIGMLFFYIQAPEHYAAMLAEIEQKDWGTRLAAQETALFGFSHAEIGGMLLRKWKLMDLAEAVASQSPGELPPEVDLLSILTIARLRLAGDDQASLFVFSRQSWLDLADIEELYHQAESSVEELAQMMGIAVAPLPVAAPSDDGRHRLTERMVSMARLEGLLASLLRASDLPGICRALEQGMAVLLGVGHVAPLIPDRDKLRFRPSRHNSLYGELAHRFWPEDDRDSCVARCRKEGLTCQISQGKHSEAEQDILALFGTAALLAVPLPLSMRRCGVVLIGLDDGQLPALQTGQETILFFAAHAGARIRQEEMREQQVRLLARRELQVAENIARGILHEIVNPLATVQNAIQVMGNNLATGHDLAATLAIISGESERIGRVAGQLRSLSESVREARLRDVDINSLLAETVGQSRERMPARRFVENFDATLPPFVSSPDILQQSIAILLDTAAKVVATNGVITVSTHHAHDNLATIEIQLSKRSDPDWHGDLLVVQLARQRLYAIDGKIVSRQNGESGWLFRLTVPMTPPALEKE